jgi:hypothetical protein
MHLPCPNKGSEARPQGGFPLIPARSAAAGGRTFELSSGRSASRQSSGLYEKPAKFSQSAPANGSVLALQSFICVFAALMKRPNALSFFRFSRYDIS